jgi:hypothetical protein
MLHRSLSFLEFLEALGRISDFVCPPPPEDMAMVGFTSETPSADYYKKGLETLKYLPDRPSAHVLAPKTRPLDQKIEQVSLDPISHFD